MALETFHLFPRLPFEIRTAIFYYALNPLPEPSVIQVHVKIDLTAPFDRHEHDSRGRHPTRSHFTRFHNPEPTVPPGLSLMWTSAESRAVVKTCYSFTCKDISSTQLASNGTSGVNSQSGAMPARVPKLKNPGVLFNSNRDIIYFRSRHGIAALSYARSSELKLSNIKTLALDLYLWKHYLISKQLFVGWEEDAPFLVGLEKLIIVLDSDQMTRCSRDARSVGDKTAVDKLRVEVEEKIATLQRLKAGIKVSVVHEDELLSETFF